MCYFEVMTGWRCMWAPFFFASFFNFRKKRVARIEEPKIQHKNKNKNNNNKSVVVLLTTFVYWFLIKTITAREGA